MKIALVTVVIVVAVFMGGLWVGLRMSERPDSVSNAMLHEKVGQETADLRDRIEGVSAKIDILLNIATNSAARDFRR